MRSQFGVNRNVTVDGAALFQALDGQLVSDSSTFGNHLVGFEAEDFTDAESCVYTDGEEKFVSSGRNDLEYVLDILVFQNCGLTGH